MLELTEPSELATLPASSPLRYLRASTIDLARQIDPIIAHLEDEKGNADFVIKVRRGEALELQVTRNFKLNEAL
jgi:hypothetical protein